MLQMFVGVCLPGVEAHVVQQGQRGAAYVVIQVSAERTTR